uniref:Phenylalanine--tRNA ligase beta subunit n=1 Tax=Candidatus Aschnera chinzeii TaxID=1485666 RepID=A0AAT9G4X2_9ENTR|nr:MAG: phenylalanine--tRNA ligase subunit beta [Candidatus Aschnera chinzeii]
MKLSELWLREFIDFNLSSKMLIKQMILLGLNINAITPVAGKFYNVVIGEVVECIQHIRINDLVIIKVNIGEKKLLNIVSHNFCKHYTKVKVVIAKIGAIISNNKEVKLMNYQGVYSEGIICSYSNLGMMHHKNNHEIIYLSNDAPIGLDIRKYLYLDDSILDFEVPTNRSDCLSVIGIARDILAVNGKQLNYKHIDVTANKKTNIINFPIHIKEPTLCPRYLGRVIKNVNMNAPLPIWMKEKIFRSGINFVNPVIDISNYILLELGQPLQIYNFDDLDTFIDVRMAIEGEQLLSNNRMINLSTDTLVIADNKKILNIAGIYDSDCSNLTIDTKNIFLESAFFNPTLIAGYSRKYNLMSKTFHYFERGVDPKIQYNAIELATQLIFDICGGEIGNIIDKYSSTHIPKNIQIILSRKKIDQLIGFSISDKNITNIFQNIGCDVLFNDNIWIVKIPSWRFDLRIEEDLIAEVVRIYGYEKIPVLPITVNLINNIEKRSHISLNRVKNLLVNRGYNEVITYSFVDPKIQMLLHPEESAIVLPHPISLNMSVMRLSLLTGLLLTVIYNQNRQQNRMKFFETGLCFVPDKLISGNIKQEFVLGGIIVGYRYKEHWLDKKSMVDFFDIKGDLESIIQLTGKTKSFFLKQKKISSLHPEQSAEIYINHDCIGYIGAIHPKIITQLGINNHIFVFELKWEGISNYEIPNIHEISRYPYHKRDIVIVISDDIPVADILSESKKFFTKNVIEINLFDVYYGEGIPEGYKSIGISITFQSILRTLKELEITIIINQYIDMLKNKFHATLRY